MAAFEDYGVMPEIIAALEQDLGWLLPTAVQAEAIPLALGGGDLLVAAETGAGKTGAFCLPIVQIVYESLRSITAASSEQATLLDQVGMSPWDHDGAFEALEGRYAFEITVLDAGLCRVGWSAATASLNLGTDAQGFGYGGTGKKSFASKFEDYGQTFGFNDVITCIADFTTGSIAFKKNGKPLGQAFSIPSGLKDVCFFPAVLLKNCVVAVRFIDLQYDEPGFTAIGNAPKDQCKTAQQVLAASKSANKRTPLAIVLEPSRELATQTMTELKRLQSHMPPPELRQVLLVGGQSAKEQEESLEEGVDLIVATPGRLLDLVAKDKIDLTEVRFFVLDEADELVSQGNSKAIVDLYRKIPKQSMRKRRLQVMFFSATLQTPQVKRLVSDITEFPTWVDLKGSVYVPETVQHVVVHINPSDLMLYEEALLNNTSEIVTDGVHKNDRNLVSWLQNPGTQATAALVAATPGGTLLPESISEIIKRMKGYHLVRLIRRLNIDRAIIFARTRIDCDSIETYLRRQLKELGKPEDICVVLHSDRSNQERQANLDRFRNKQTKYLICTDVAARGIDIKGLPFLINYSLPDETASYVHRVGRVGRADCMGLAISLAATAPEKVWYHSNCRNPKTCTDVRLTENGGCTIWYDEPALLKEIEKYLDLPLDELSPELEQILLDPNQRAVFGAKRAKTTTIVESHAAEVAPRLATLTALEDQAYQLYYALKLRSW